MFCACETRAAVLAGEHMQRGAVNRLNAAKADAERVLSTSSACCLAGRFGSTAKWMSCRLRSSMEMVYGRFVSALTHLATNTPAMSLKSES